MGKDIYYEISTSKNAAMAILVSNQVDLRTRKITRNKEEHYIMVKGSLHQVDRAILNVCATNTRALKYMKQKLT